MRALILTALDAEPSASLIMFPRASLNMCIFLTQKASPRKRFLISSCEIHKEWGGLEYAGGWWSNNYSCGKRIVGKLIVGNILK